MKRETLMLILLVSGILFLFLGLTILIAGNSLYGDDAALLFAAGMLTFMGVNALGNFTNYLIELYEERKK